MAHSHSSDHKSRSPIDWMSGYTMVLVDADSKDELYAARDFIAAQGGTVSVVMPPHAIFGWITPEVGSRIIGRYKIRSLHRSPVEPSAAGFRDRETVAAIKSFNEVASGRSAERTMREIRNQSANPASRPPLPDCSLPTPQIDRNEFLRTLRSMGGAQSQSMLQSTVTPQFWNNSDVMDGTVAVGAFLIESNGGIDTNVYNWSLSDQDLAIAQIIQGLNWWVDQSRAFTLSRPLQFTLVPFLPNNPAAQVPYEPALREGSSANLWVNHIMANFGGTSSNTFVNVAAFNRILKEQNRTNWAFTIFMAYNPPPSQTSFADGRASWAFIGGPHTNMLFRSYGWEINQIVSHEVGHIFFACDEYSQPGFQSCSCSCAPEVRPDAKNGNCEDFNCNRNSTSCIMRLNEAALCPFTVAQIGWATSVPKPLPSAPASLVATAASPTVVNLIWQDTSRETAGAADGFQIERRGGSSADFAQIGVVSAVGGSTDFSDSTVLPNTAYAYRVRAFNLTGASPPSNEAPVITPITPSALSISTTDMPDATVEVSYSKALTAVGGGSSYTWLIESGALPSGLTLSQTGTVSGIATAVGNFNFVARVTDENNNRATKALSLRVRPAAPLTITTLQLPRGSVGTPYSQTLGASGGQTPYLWSVQSGSLPEGLILSEGGTISGIPDRAGTSSFVLKLTDAANATQTATLSMIVNPGAVQLSIDTDSLSDGVVGQNYSETLAAVGGSAPYTWSLTSGSLPAGLELSESGAISGRPIAPGESEFEVQVRDQSGQSIRKSLSIDVDPASQLTILNQTVLPPAAVGVPYSVELKATSGTSPYTWGKKKKAKFGNFPDGITLSPQGILSGTPTAQGTSNFTINVKDASGRTATKPLSIEVGPPPAPLAITTETLPNATQGLPYNVTLQGSGGVGPYTWSVETGALPSGLTLSPEGEITGRATGLGAAAFTLRLRDSLGTTTTKPTFIVVVPPPPPLVIQTVSLPETFAERPYSQTLQASGGLPPYSWSLVSGNIGAGLSLSVDGTISGTPQVPGLSVFVIRVTDSAQQTVSRTLAINIRPADRIVPFGDMETPGFRATLTNVATGSGWALDNTGVTLIEVLVDGTKVGEAIYGLPRPDIASIWGNFPNGGNSGFSFSFDTRLLTNGEHRISVRILDASGNATVVGNRPINVQNQVLAVSTFALPNGRRNDLYSTQLMAVNGRPPYTWELVSGALPQGLSLNQSGVISGTPSVFGNFSFGVRVRDSAGATASASFSLTIVSDVLQLLIVSRGEQPEAGLNVDYSLQLLGAGGSPPRVWSLAGGTLPPGLSLPPTGLITGKPTQTGTFVFTVRLSDSAGASVMQELSIRVIQPLAIGNATGLPQGTVDANYSHQFSGSGGTAPYLWDVVSGALPAGLSINFNTGVISGRPTRAGTFTFTVRLIDAVFRTVNSAPVTIVVVEPPEEERVIGFTSLTRHAEPAPAAPAYFISRIDVAMRFLNYWRSITG